MPNDGIEVSSTDFLPVDLGTKLGSSKNARQLLSGEPDSDVGSEEVGVLESGSNEEVRLKDVVFRRRDEFVELLDERRRSDDDLLREVSRSEG